MHGTVAVMALVERVSGVHVTHSVLHESTFLTALVRRRFDGPVNQSFALSLVTAEERQCTTVFYADKMPYFG